MQFPNVVYGSEGQQYLNSATKGMPYGQKMELEDGRVFRYCLNDSTATVVGSIYQAVAGNAEFDDEAVEAIRAIGATQVSLTNGTTVLVADELQNGYILFYTPDATPAPGTLKGGAYLIKSNQKAGNGATYKVDLKSPEGLVVALTTSDKYSVIHNLWYKVTLFDVSAAPTARMVGAAVRIITASYYGFLQTRGVCEILVDDAAAMDPGDTCSWPAAAGATAGDGFNDNSVASNDGDVEDIGVNINIASTDDGALVFLKFE